MEEARTGSITILAVVRLVLQNVKLLHLLTGTHIAAGGVRRRVLRKRAGRAVPFAGGRSPDGIVRQFPLFSAGAENTKELLSAPPAPTAQERTRKLAGPSNPVTSASLSPRSLHRATRILGSAHFHAWLYGLVAAIPLCFVTFQVALWVRNFPNWDEFDTVLDLLITLDAGASGGDVLKRLFAVTNEHRTLASRLIFAASYWLTGGVNFAALAVLGNLFLAGTFAIVLAHVRDVGARWRLAAIFALVVFQLQHHENLFWAGASIDHFFVVLMALAALATVGMPGRLPLALGCGAAFFATFSLAHGLLVWPIGGALLAAQRRWRAAAVWAGVTALSTGLYFAGFHFNSGHPFPAITDLPRVVIFWLTLIGSSPAMDNLTIAPWYGALLVLTATFLVYRVRQPRENFALAAIVWCVAAMALIAWGRALLASEFGLVTSRYVILSSIAWALLIWLVAERALVRRPARPWWLVVLLLMLADFNIRASDANLAAGRVHAQNMEQAALCFQRDGTFTAAAVPPYPDPARADALLHEAEDRDLVDLPPPETLVLADVAPVVLEGPREIDDAVYCVDDFEVTATTIHVRGWAFRPDEPTRLGQHRVVFRAGDAVIAFQPFAQLRPDVAEAYERPDAIYAGFDLRVPREKLPPRGRLTVGIGFEDRDGPEFMMTANTLTVGPSPALAAKE